MPKERMPEEVYGDLAEQGMYEEANFDKGEIEKIKRITLEDYEYGKDLRKSDNPNWRVIFNIHYDALREFCSLLMIYKRQKTSNHQGLFAFIVLNFPEIDFSWEFLEMIRNMRNMNKYKGADITKEAWKSVEFQMDLYISTLNKKV